MSVKDLIEKLQSPELHAWDKQSIVDSLGVLGDEAAVPALGEILGNKGLHPDLRVAAAKALGQIGGQKAALLLASHEDPVSNAVRDALRFIYSRRL